MSRTPKFMNQDLINQQEWNNRENWTMLCHHSQRDTRVFITIALLMPLIGLALANLTKHASH